MLLVLGSPHIHSLVWLEDDDGNAAPHYRESDELSKVSCVEFVDSVIKGQKESSEDATIRELAETLQNHNHTFTCYKKKRMVTIPEKEGHGRLDGVKVGPCLKVPVCRFLFPRPPLRESCLIEPPNDDTHPDTVKQWKEFWTKTRLYMLRQAFQEYPGQVTDERRHFLILSFEEFLDELGLTEEQYKNGLRIMVKSKGAQVLLKRDCADVFTNNYNPELLSLHRANIDVSFITNEYACAAYILGYLTKGEAGVSKLLKTLDDETAKYGMSVEERLKKFARAIDTSREVSIQEIVYRTLGLGMCVGSRVVKFINASKPELRDGLLKKNLDDTEENESPFMNSLIDYYQARPVDLNDLSLAEFAAQYDLVYSGGSKIETVKADDDHLEETNHLQSPNAVPLLNGMGFIRRRGFEAVIRYYLDRKNEEEMKRNMLVLFHPFRDEEKEIHNHRNLSIDDLFSANFDSIEERRMRYEPHRELLVNITEHLQDLNEESDEDEEVAEDLMYQYDETTSEKDIKDHGKTVTSGTSRSAEVKFLTSLTEIRERVRMLNFDQRRIFDDVIERLWSPVDAVGPFHLYVAGDAGTGKSYLVKTMIEAGKHLSLESGAPLDRTPVLVLCPTATSAGIIGGDTIEGALKMFPGKSSFETPTMNYSAEGSLGYSFEHLSAIFLEEVSMIGSRKFHTIHSRIEQVKGKEDTPFSATPVIATGDFHQLPPVNDRYIYNNSNIDGRPQNLAPNFWKIHFEIFELKEKMRNLDDPDFASVCDAVGRGEVSEQIKSYFEEKVDRVDNDNFHDLDSFKNGHVAIIVADNAKVDSVNNTKLSELLPEEERITFRAEDKVKNVDKVSPRLEDVPYTRTGGMRTLLTVKNNCPILLTKNLDKQDFLTNGQRGHIVEVDEANFVIWVKFHDPKVGAKRRRVTKFKQLASHPDAVPITRDKSTFTWGGGGSSIRIMRTQFPLVVAFAMTVHKSQGMTIQQVMIDFTDSEGKPVRVPSGSFYVAVTRVRRGVDLFLTHFSSTFIKCNPSVEEELARMRKRRPYRFHKTFLFDDVFSGSGDGEQPQEVKFSYLNINGLLDNDHLEDVKHDQNLLASDYICIAESKIDAKISDDVVSIPSFSVVARLNSLDGKRSRGMVLYMKRGADSSVTVLDQQRCDRYEYILVLVKGVQYSFVYFHPSATKEDFHEVNDTLTLSSVVMGDLNINTRDAHGVGIRCLKNLAENTSKKSVLDEPTHQQFGQPDHVLIDKDFPFSYYATSFKNLYSDHNSITFRMSELEVEVGDVGDKTEADKENHHSEEQDATKGKGNVRGESLRRRKVKREMSNSENLVIDEESDEEEEPDVVVFDEASGLKLYRRDMKELDSENWLRGNMIDFYLQLCVRGNPLQLAFPTHFYNIISQHEVRTNYARVRRLTLNTNLFDLKLLLLPIHLTNHWVLVSVHGLDTGLVQIKLHDPKYKDRFSHVLDSVRDYLEVEHEEKMKEALNATVELIVEYNIPSQSNDHDCGIYLCQLAKCLAKQVDPNFSESDMPALRTQMKKEVKWKRVVVTPPPRGTENSSSSGGRRLSSKKARGDKPSFRNPTGDQCWLNSSLQLIIRAMDMKVEVQITSDLGRALQSFRTTLCPKNGFDSTGVRLLVSVGQFQHMMQNQQCVAEFLQCMNQQGLDGFRMWPDVVGLFNFESKTVVSCVACGHSRELQVTENLHVDIKIPEDCYGRKLSGEVMKNLIESYFDHPKYNQQRVGCDDHQNSGAYDTEVLVSCPDFLLVLINRIVTSNEDGQLVYLTRKEECVLPEHVTLPLTVGRQEYQLFAAVEWKGTASPTTGRTHGHYSAFVRFSDSWYHMNDAVVKKTSARTVTKKAYLVGYTKYEV